MDWLTNMRVSYAVTAAVCVCVCEREIGIYIERERGEKEGEREVLVMLVWEQVEGLQFARRHTSLT
jgi:hypothetical protein